MFLDKRYGRDALKKLLGTATNEEALRVLKLTERQLIDDWKRGAASVER